MHGPKSGPGVNKWQSRRSSRRNGGFFYYPQVTFALRVAAIIGKENLKVKSIINRQVFINEIYLSLFNEARDEMFSRTIHAILIISFCFSATCFAVPIEVGQGVNTAYVYIEWADSYVAEFNVKFGSTSADTTTGIALVNLIEANTSLVTEQFSGGFVDGISYLSHSNIGFKGGDNWWHYWTLESDATDWVAPQTFGAAGRIVENGDSDGWVYGRGTAVPEPVMIALLGLGGMFLRRRKA